ncbi:mycofactocin precursor [Mycobacterium sp. MS1601]|nr:mycofactocin precursor [Mycobacterium sp. MS1601]
MGPPRSHRRFSSSFSALDAILFSEPDAVSSVTSGRECSMDNDSRVDSDAELVTESLVEEVSIDGMCGVY